jgi:hypothetical protein
MSAGALASWPAEFNVAQCEEYRSMDTYSFVVEDFIIRDTRALHNDTLYLSYSAYVDGDAVANRVISLGDFDNGEYSTTDYVSDAGGLGPVVINDPTAKVAFIFQLVNNGNVPAGALTGRLAATADQLAGITAGLAGAGATGITVGDTAAVSSVAFPAGLLVEAFATLWSWLTVDCDGPVAVDQISGPRYALDAWTDNSTKSIRVQGRKYPGTDSPTGCGGNSNYELNWSLQHSRTWAPVADTLKVEFISETGVSASEHNGAVHAFGAVTGGVVNHARTFTGATWYVDTLGAFNLAKLPVSAISFKDRLYVFGVQADASIASIAFTGDGTTWVPFATGPAALLTNEPIATTVFRHRLYLLARDSASSQLRMTSTSDLRLWNPWVDVPPAMQPASPVAAATLGERLFIFGIFKTGKSPDLVILRNSTSDGSTWSGWDLVEAGLRPEQGSPTDYPVDVAAGIFQGRLYIACRWAAPAYYIAVNFSEDGDNWSGWRIPESDVEVQPSGPAGLAAVHNHLYIFAPRLIAVFDDMRVWAY